MNAAWEAIEAEEDMSARAGRAPYGWTPDEAETAAIKHGAIAELARRGYADLSLDEEDLPGIHIVEKIAIDDRCIYLVTGSAAETGQNELFMPDLNLPRTNPEAMKIFTRRIKNLSFEAPQGADSRQIDVGEISVGSHFSRRVIIVLDPEGGSWSESFATALRLARAMMMVRPAPPAPPRRTGLREKLSELFSF